MPSQRRVGKQWKSFHLSRVFATERLKHTFLTRLQNVHVDYEVRQALGGHKMKGMTATYSHGGKGWDKKLRSAVNRLQLSYKLSDGLIPEELGQPKLLKDMVPRRRIELRTPAFSGLDNLPNNQQLMYINGIFNVQQYQGVMQWVDASIHPDFSLV